MQPEPCVHASPLRSQVVREEHRTFCSCGTRCRCDAASPAAPATDPMSAGSAPATTPLAAPRLRSSVSHAQPPATGRTRRRCHGCPFCAASKTAGGHGTVRRRQLTWPMVCQHTATDDMSNDARRAYRMTQDVHIATAGAGAVVQTAHLGQEAICVVHRGHLPLEIAHNDVGRHAPESVRW